jgi:dipeptidyl-peptidase-4
MNLASTACAYLHDLAEIAMSLASKIGATNAPRGTNFELAAIADLHPTQMTIGMREVAIKRKRWREMDVERVGIVGWSFGGYMSALAVLKRPDVFKAAVAGAPVVDWLDYDTHYTERYLGMPDTDADAYREGSLLTYAADLERPLLLVHGTSDDNVFFRHTLKLTDALFRAGKYFELLPLSGLTHMVPDPVITEQLWSRVASHFQKHLGKPMNGRN